MSSNNNIRSSDKWKEIDPSKVWARKKKTSGIGLQLLFMWDQLIESMLTRSDYTSLHMDKKWCSISVVMIEIHSIPGVLIEDDFHDFATKYLSLRRKREMWSSMRDLKNNLKWINRMYALSKHA
jgi:hypothetical protein